MEKIENQVITYKYYSHQGKRMAIMGTKENDRIKMFIITCSKRDSFCKREARSAFKSLTDEQPPLIYGELAHPKIMYTKSSSGNWKKDFYTFCKTTFYKLEDYNGRISCRIKRFNRNGQIIPISIKPNPGKLDLR